MAKYVIEDSSKEIAELKNKCKLVKERISRIGIMLPPIQLKEIVVSSIRTLNDDYSASDNSKTETDIKRELLNAKTGNM